MKVPSRTIKVIFVNDIAFVATTLIPELARAGATAKVIGRTPLGPSRERSSFLSNTLAIYGGLPRAGTYEILHINYGLFGFAAFGSRVPTTLHRHGSDIRPGLGIRRTIMTMASQVGNHRASVVWYSTTDLSTFVRGIPELVRYMLSPVCSSFLRVAPSVESPPHVLFAIPPSREKGADLGIAAMWALAWREPDLRISAFCFGRDGQAVATLMPRMPLSVPPISWTSHEKMRELFSSVTLVVGRLGIGNLGITELEAMASGRALITNIPPSVCESEEYYQDEPPVLSYGNAASVVDTIMRPVTDSGEASTLGHLAREWTAKYHADSVVADAYRREYERLIEM